MFYASYAVAAVDIDPRAWDDSDNWFNVTLAIERVDQQDFKESWIAKRSRSLYHPQTCWAQKNEPNRRKRWQWEYQSYRWLNELLSCFFEDD